MSLKSNKSMSCIRAKTTLNSAILEGLLLTKQYYTNNVYVHVQNILKGERKTISIIQSDYSRVFSPV